jgi:glycosyltransferase involved in cell wall biosynthesis
MRIAEISTVAAPVVSDTYSSIEGLVWLLSSQLTRIGHDVTVFATADSEPDGELVATLPGAYTRNGSPDNWQVCEWINLCRAIEQSERFDVLHSHSYLTGLPLRHLSRRPMVHTMHVQPYDDDARIWALAPDACVTAISLFQWSRFPHLKPKAIIYHGLDPSRFQLNVAPDDYLCYLGRLIPGKGAKFAVKAARELGMRLVLAGPIVDEYYGVEVEPHVDGDLVEYVGTVTGSDRWELLAGARALLFPLQAPEPFGLVLIEAMMCGTPVVATQLGASEEIVDEGVTGFLAETPEDLVNSIVASIDLDREVVRQHAERRFSHERMAAEYLRVYEQVAAATEDPSCR